MGTIVSIVGRPNVGKSTFFNRMVEQRKAITDDESGVTRDRHYGISEWNGKTFTVVDTGGYVEGSDDIFEGAIREQVKLALAESHIILFMVDCKDGLTDLDKDFAHIVRATNKPVLTIANKADNQSLDLAAAEFYALGLGDVFTVSSISGSGTGELLDELTKLIPEEENDAEDTERPPQIAIVGRPNVGKSSLLNLLLGQERSIVTEIEGTTRDSINSHYKGFGHEFILVDTAGIKRRSANKTSLEIYSEVRSIKAIQQCDVCIVLIDAQQGLESQDMNIINLSARYKKGIIIGVNKWDLIDKDTHTVKTFSDVFSDRLGDLKYIPFIFMSVLEKQRVVKLIEKAIKIYENRKSRISTNKLNKLVLPEIEKHPPPAYRGNYIKIKYITQLPTPTPTFAFFANHPKEIKAPYQRFLENTMRRLFDFEGVPIKLIFRKK